VLVALSLLGGHPESAFHAVGFALVYAGFRLWASGQARVLWPRVLGWLAGAGFLGAALAGVTLVPFTELLALSSDFGNREGNETLLPLRWLAAAAMPEYFGTPLDASGGSVTLGTAGLFIARALYAGALPLMLALVALIPALGLRGRGAVRALADRRFFGAVAVFCLAIAFGLPGLFDLVRSVPVLGQNNNTRLIVVYLIALAALAGFGVDDLRELAGLRRGWTLALVAAVVLLPAVVVGLTLPPLSAVWDGVKLALGQGSATDDFDVLHVRALFWWLLFGGLGAALLAARCSGRLALRAFLVLALLFVSVDLFRAGQGFTPAISESTAKLPTTPAIRFLQDQRPARFAGFARTLAPNQAIRYGLYDARNYDFPIVKRYDVIWRRFVFPLPYQAGAPQWLLTLTPASLRVLGLLGVRDVIVPPDEAAYARELRIPPDELGTDLPGLAVVYDAADGRIYRHRAALPRAFVVHAQSVAGSEEESLEQVGDPDGPDLARVAVTERPLEGIARAGEGGTAPAASKARIVSYSPQRVVLETDARTAGLAVLTDVHYPGWNATVDGRSESIERVDYLVRGVRVPAGKRRVVFTYEPATFTVGWILSLAGLLLLGAAAVVLVLRRGRSTHPVDREAHGSEGRIDRS
jgi:hypothetical protein